jgi:hypothetical protein
MPLVGHTRCIDPACGAEGIAVHRTSGGKIYAACHRCELTQQPKLGSVAHRRMLKRTTLAEDEGGAPPPEPADDAPTPPAPERAAAVKKVASAFDLGGL